MKRGKNRAKNAFLQNTYTDLKEMTLVIWKKHAKCICKKGKIEFNEQSKEGQLKLVYEKEWDAMQSQKP